MILSPMRFKGVTWQYNPHTINISCQKNMVENKIHLNDSILQNFGRNARVISGEGCMYGEDCFTRMAKLWKLYRSNESGLLMIPEFTAVRAMFSSLKIIGEPTDKLIKYSFSFTEIMETVREQILPDIHIVRFGENLWDISFNYSICVETLLKLNPNIRHPFSLSEGDEVRLC
ncbi:MAG: LysM peptidoglycan-binding domain-containing protein [Ruminococcus sp.]|nr:LysM peptidoglycan-binding domain-containing protein [Ruminococcus sp.]